MLIGEECCEVVSMNSENERTVLCRVYTNLQTYMIHPVTPVFRELYVPTSEL